MGTWFEGSWNKFSIVTVIVAVLLSIILAGLLTRQRTSGLETRMERAESVIAQTTHTLNSVKSQFEANQGRSEQLVREQRVHSERDADGHAVTDSELRDMRAELKMLRQSVFTMRPAARSRRR